ncbi:MAG: PucR family transcriptional regulator [Solirubrobacterales bacterium]
MKEISVEEARDLVSARLKRQLPEIETAVHRHIRSIVEAAPPTDPEYVAGVQEATREAIDYAIAGIETGVSLSEALPAAVAKQARRAARSGIPLDTVLRRYHAGDRRLSEWMTGVAGDIPPGALQEIVRTQGLIVDRLTAGVAAEFKRELERSGQTPPQRLRERVRAMLDGLRDHDSRLPYDFRGWHLGLIGTGGGVEDGIRRAARQADRQVLCVPGISDDRVWAWLGGRAKPDIGVIEAALEQCVPEAASICVGGLHPGLEGWRLTHAEAEIALQVAIYKPATVTRSRDVVLLSAVLRDPSLTESIMETFLRPLDIGNGRGPVLRQTLRSYLGAEQNAATTAHRLEIDRATVRRRLTSVETLLGLKIDTYAPQLQVALAIEELLATAPELSVGSRAR